ncbi:hypothetical protein LOK49_LG11G01724 [Camellia lanceoleosa]|uniref:Uncharacterized protein n=1 Tax=Camellia lanceoleosa TaxID=1840588 RepID=A0ACC0G3K7_9ERIC|nr:hypothetical protein LOK49_LG11G01724 [Camellia lanceoleosa]
MQHQSNHIKKLTLVLQHTHTHTQSFPKSDPYDISLILGDSGSHSHCFIAESKNLQEDNSKNLLCDHKLPPSMAPVAPRSGDTIFANVERVVRFRLRLLSLSLSLSLFERRALHPNLWGHRASTSYGSGGGRGSQQTA